MMDIRASGLLLHPASLPSAHGIGDLGAAAYQLIDRLENAGQKYWQILPLNPSNPTTGESPYFSSSAFAGNPLLIDLQALVEKGLLSESEIQPAFKFSPHDIDYEKVRSFKMPLLYKACDRLIEKEGTAQLNAFREQQEWLDDYALFKAIHQQQQKASWALWPAQLRDRDPATLTEARKTLAALIRREEIIQFWFFEQWAALKNYANSKGITIFGDMPIYVSFESADVWTDSRFFKLDANKKPIKVSGVPPDYFSATGQLWNNPVYDWTALEQDNFQWWIKRMKALFERFDIVRIDHFRGLVQFWEVPAGEKTAIHGQWQDVPTRKFFDTLLKALPNFPVVVEDLGIITPDVVEVKGHYGFPGMLILQFAFGEDNSKNPYLPENHDKNAVVYLGTHDNNTALAWYTDELDEAAKSRIKKYIGQCQNTSELIQKLIELTLSSPANTAIISAQDLLCLPGRARINDPSDNFGNWTWRLTQDEFTALPLDSLRELCEKHQRT